MGLFKNLVTENEQFNEAFNQPPYEYTFGKKNATEVFFTFQEEGEDKEYRIMFAASAGMGKNVRRILIGERVGTSNTTRNVIKKFKNPLRVIATLTAAVEEFLITPMGMKIEGFAIFIPAIAGNRLDEFMKLLFKRNAKLRSKLALVDTKLKLDEKGFYLWTVRKGKNPAEVFNGELVSGMFPDQVLGDEESTSTPTQQTNDNTYLSPDEVVEKLYANLKGDGYEIDIQRSIMGKESVYVKTDDIRSVITVKATKEKVYMVVPVLNDKFESSWSMINANLTLLIGRIRKVELVNMQSEEPTPNPEQIYNQNRNKLVDWQIKNAFYTALSSSFSLEKDDIITSAFNDEDMDVMGFRFTKNGMSFHFVVDERDPNGTSFKVLKRGAVLIQHPVNIIGMSEKDLASVLETHILDYLSKGIDNQKTDYQRCLDAVGQLEFVTGIQSEKTGNNKKTVFNTTDPDLKIVVNDPMMRLTSIFVFNPSTGEVLFERKNTAEQPVSKIIDALSTKWKNLLKTKNQVRPDYQKFTTRMAEHRLVLRNVKSYEVDGLSTLYTVEDDIAVDVDYSDLENTKIKVYSRSKGTVLYQAENADDTTANTIKKNWKNIVNAEQQNSTFDRNQTNVIEYNFDGNIETFQKLLNELVANGSTVEGALGVATMKGWDFRTLTNIIYERILGVAGVTVLDRNNTVFHSGNTIHIELSLNNYFKVDLEAHKVEYSGMFQDSLKLNKDNNILEISDALNEYMTRLANDISLSESESNRILPDGYQENVFRFKVKFRSGSPARLYVHPISEEAKEIFGVDEYKTLWFESDEVGTYAVDRLNEYREISGLDDEVKK
ncbi:hypothetical protein Kuja_0190 [Vibrio phage vB_VchM_Kuja]|uniref:Uncharacterized protein n=1 Tax=Vibrio phage vB_VchM_Kuja TaxID=2686437 RepID=A0A6B9J522_9CAUD|nr:hypothetical protein HWC83_gp019 [Vibrio phage vB_VchM_Kuja]QGZ16010.1 hypothetical protein Kuja_0190 [Vibrio phage vB_VchM_Kuja]